MKVLHLFISKSSDGLLGLDSWCETNPFLLGASVGKKGWFWFCKILLSFCAADWCYHLETWWGTPYSCSSLTLWSLRTWESGFHLTPQDSCGKLWRLSSPWGQRMSWVERGRMKRKGAALLACQGLSQLGKDSECDWLQFCCPTWQPAAAQSWYFAENASLFTWKVSFLSPQTLYIQAADRQIVILSGWNISFTLVSKGHWQKRLWSALVQQ